MKRFVLHWGEMGSRWGVNRTVGQIHALLFLSPEPLPAEAIAETLSVARSNVSNSLRELQGWGVVKVVHVLGDRRDHFEAMQDVWEMVRVILDERKKREFDPTLAVLRELTETAAGSGARDPHTHERLAEMLSFFESVAGWYAQMRRLPTGSVIKFVKMGDKVRKLLGLAS
ncbi:MAG: GbsR/MarR family transcriptional regulator [Planctomycetota bacterium]|jgi:DNA-binding transcriptional regulator GbsR (MarR family)